MSNPKTTATEFFRDNKAPDKTTHIAVRKGLDVCLFVVRNEWCDYSSVESGFMIAKSFWDIFAVTEFVRASELTSGVTAEEKAALSEISAAIDKMEPIGTDEIFSYTPTFSKELMEAFDHYDGLDEFAPNSAIRVSRDKAFSIALKLYREMKK